MTLDEKEQIKQQNTETVNEKNPTVFSSITNNSALIMPRSTVSQLLYRTVCVPFFS